MRKLSDIYKFCEENSLECILSVSPSAHRFYFIFSNGNKVYHQAITAIDMLETVVDNVIPCLLEKVKTELCESVKEDSLHLCNTCCHTYPSCPAKSYEVIFNKDTKRDNIVHCLKHRKKDIPRPFSPMTEEFKDEI